MVTGWPRQLRWSDFQTIPNPGPGVLLARNGHPIVAKVVMAIHFITSSSQRHSAMEWGETVPSWRYRNVDVRVGIDAVHTQYVPSRIPAGRTAHYLLHEQGHMDLMGLFACELSSRLARLRAPSEPALLLASRPIVFEVVGAATGYAINTASDDCQYDRDTNHGMNERGQRRWNAIIARNIAARSQPNYTFRT